MVLNFSVGCLLMVSSYNEVDIGMGLSISARIQQVCAVKSGSPVVIDATG